MKKIFFLLLISIITQNLKAQNKLFEESFSIPKKTDSISVYEREKIQTLVSPDFEIAEIKRSSDSTYIYVTGRTFKNDDYDTQMFNVLLIKNVKEIVSKISMETLWIRDYTALQASKKIKIDGVDEVMKIPFGEGDCCYVDTTVLFFRKKDKLIKGLQIRSAHGVEGDYETKKIISPKDLSNQVWIENTVGYIDYENDDKVHNYFTHVEKYTFQNDSLVLMNPKQEENFYFVTAKSGLNARYRPYLSSEIKNTLAYGTKVKVLNKTDLSYEIWDGFKAIKGNWVQIETKNEYDTIETSYVFDGYLSKELADINTETETSIANGKWAWRYANGQLGELGFYKNGKKEGEWKWFFKDGALKATGSYKNGEPVGARKWYYSNYKLNNNLYCTGQYSDEKKDGEWKWYYNDKTTLSINFDKGNVVEFEVFDNKEKVILNTKNTSTSEVIFEEPYDHRDVFEVEIKNTDAYNVALYDPYLEFYKSEDNLITGEWKKYKNGKLYNIGYYKKGDQTGVWKQYRSNGELEKTETYKRDKRNGVAKYYYINGTLQSTGNYKKGLKKGVWKTYYKNGKIHFREKYKKGKYNGGRKEYYKSGKIKSIANYKNAKLNGEWKAYYENGKLKEIKPYKDGKIHGEWTKYNEEGILVEKNQMNNGDFIKQHETYYHANGNVSKTGKSDNEGKKYGEWRYYYPSGKLKKIEHYKNGRKDGEWKSYYENGQLKAQGQYIKGDGDGKFIFYKEDGKIKHAIAHKYNSPYVMGEWEYFDNGQLKSAELYRRKEPVNWEYYHPNGQIKERRYYKSEEKEDGSIWYRRETGNWEYYYPNGQLRLLEAHQDDCRSGQSLYYHENGQLYKIELWKCDDRLSDALVCYDDKGNTLDAGNLKDGNGTVKEYNAKGELINEVQYEQGRKTKNSISLDEVWHDNHKISNLAANCYENENDISKLNNGIKWIEHAIKLNKGYYNTLIYAALLNKTNQNKKALVQANDALYLLKNETPNSKQEKRKFIPVINELIKQIKEELDIKNVSAISIWDDSDKLNAKAWDLCENENDITKLNDAIKWIQRSIELNQNYYNTDTYAALLYKTGKYTQALAVANKAIEIAKKRDNNYKATEELIEKINKKL